MHPLRTYLGEVAIVKWLLEVFRTVVPEFASAVEHIVVPVALVGDLAVLIVKFRETRHFVSMPFAFIVSAVLVKITAKALPKVVKLKAFVAATVLVGLVDVLQLCALGWFS